MQNTFAQVEVLLQAHRYGDAEIRLCEALAADPDSARAHTLLSYALCLQGRNAAALHEAETAIGLDPGDATSHYFRALILLALERAGSAMSAIQEAIRLEPEHASYHALVSRIHVKRKAWSKALVAAEEGLRIDPGNVQCLNLRGTALVNLGRRSEGGQALAAALARDPEDAWTHANQGWALLHAGDQHRALAHFREALRLNPLLDRARSGIVEALKARNPLYRLMLRYFLWMSRLTAEEQWETVATVSSAWYALRAIARTVPILYVVLLPLSLLYYLFSLLTWTARPLFALMLRFDPVGRLALPREEVAASNWIAACLLTTGGSVIAGLVAWNAAFLALAAAALAMILPIAGVYHCNPGFGRLILTVYSVLLALVSLAAFGLSLIGSWALVAADLLGIAFAVGWASFSWIASLVIWLSR